MQQARDTSALPSVTLARGGAANTNQKTGYIGVLANLQQGPTKKLKQHHHGAANGGRPRGCSLGPHQRMWQVSGHPKWGRSPVTTLAY